jgi:hypothetical protein
MTDISPCAECELVNIQQTKANLAEALKRERLEVQQMESTLKTKRRERQRLHSENVHYVQTYALQKDEFEVLTEIQLERMANQTRLMLKTYPDFRLLTRRKSHA